MSSYGQTASTLWGPTLRSIMLPKQQEANGNNNNNDDDEEENVLEVSLHTLPRQLQREFQHVFDDRNLNLDPISQRHDDHQQQLLGALEYLAIPTNQHAQHDLVGTGEAVEIEKDRLLNVFMKFGRSVCEKVRAQGYWADFIDPCSGLPMLTLNCNKVYSEVDGMECCLGYKSYNAGFCKILTHPAWGSAVYPATMFAFAPRSVMIRILDGIPRPAK